MVIETLKILFSRDLNKLYREIELYKTEDALWQIENQIQNSSGNLCLHLIGNLNTYIGKIIGNTGYLRDREKEFSLKNIPQKTLLEQINNTNEIVNKSLDVLSDELLNEEYPIKVFENKTSTGFMLMHLTTHLTYHLGQINYHRRIIER